MFEGWTGKWKRRCVVCRVESSGMGKDWLLIRMMILYMIVS